MDQDRFRIGDWAGSRVSWFPQPGSATTGRDRGQGVEGGRPKPLVPGRGPTTCHRPVVCESRPFSGSCPYNGTGSQIQLKKFRSKV
jgi:hypothetical protein